MKLSLLLLSLALTACGTTSSPFNSVQVLAQRSYVVRTAPDQLKTLPPLPTALANPRTATNVQIATWINSSEAYTAQLEAMLQTLISFYEAPVTVGEAGAMRAVTPLQTPAPNGSRVLQPQPTLQGAAASVTGAANGAAANGTTAAPATAPATAPTFLQRLFGL